MSTVPCYSPRPRSSQSASGERASARAMASEHSSIPGATRHTPRDGGGHYSLRSLPDDLAESEEAAEVWEAAKSASHENRQAIVQGWRIEWRPRASSGKGGTKRGDLYIFQPAGEGSVMQATGGRAIRSLSALHDVLTLRLKAQQGGEMWHPPLRGTLVEVRLDADEECAAAAGETATATVAAAATSTDAADEVAGEEGAEPPALWRRAEVRRVDPGLAGSFQVVVHNAAGEPDEQRTQVRRSCCCCSAAALLLLLLMLMLMLLLLCCHRVRHRRRRRRRRRCCRCCRTRVAPLSPDAYTEAQPQPHSA